MGYEFGSEANGVSESSLLSSSSLAAQYLHKSNLSAVTSEKVKVIYNIPSKILQNFSSDEVINDNGTTKEYTSIGVDDPTVFTFMYVVSLGGYIVNATLLLTICCRQKFRRATNYLLANLCISSILFLLAVNLRLSERTHGPLWHYTDLNCPLWSVIRRIPQALASLTIVAISCDRSQAARILFTRPCSTDMTKKILRIWIIAILTTVPRGFLYRYSPDLETPVPVYKCAPVAVGPYGIFNVLYAFFHLLSVFMLPMCILICDIYSTVQKIVFLKSRHQTHVNQQESHRHETQNTQLHRKQLQLLRNSCIFAALFLVCWLPWGIYQHLGDLPKSIVSPEFRHLIWIHFKTVRYLPFTVTAFLPFILVVCTYDANILGGLRKCCGINCGANTSSAAVPGENYRQNNDIQGRAAAENNGPGCRQNRPRPLRLLVNHVHQHNYVEEKERSNIEIENDV